MIDLRGKGNQRRAATAIKTCMMDGKELPDLLLARRDSRRTQLFPHHRRCWLRLAKMVLFAAACCASKETSRCVTMWGVNTNGNTKT